ncbi:MAG: hypothetical protein CMJ46_03490 [Planctomyces sp.]|nr:hypothetical protein [Planctomyces sp.]
MLITGTLVTCGILSGCAQAFKTTASDSGEFPTARLLAMAEAFETQGDYERANTLHEAIRLRDPNASWITSDTATPKADSTSLNNQSPVGSLADMPAPTAYFEQTAPEAFGENLEINIQSADADTAAGLQPAPRDTENLFGTHPPFDMHELRQLEAAESTEERTIELAAPLGKREQLADHVEIPLFDEELFETAEATAEETDSMQVASRGEESVASSFYANDAVEVEEEFSGTETMLTSTESGLRSSQPEVVTALHEVELTPASSSSTLDNSRTRTDNTRDRRTPVQSISADEFALPVIQR